MSDVQKNKKQKAIELRLAGKSYGEILKILNIPSKGTLSPWLKNVELTPEAKKGLEKNMLAAYQRGLFKFNKRRTQRIKIENKNSFEKASSEIKKISKRDLLLIGVALYWGEGTTRESKKIYQSISFSNSDPNMVKVFMKYLRKVLEVNDAKMRPNVHIHKNIGQDVAINFWADVTNLPQSHFHTYDAVSKSSKLKRPANFLPYGTFNIRVTDRRLFCKIRGYIDGIVNQVT